MGKNRAGCVSVIRTVTFLMAFTASARAAEVTSWFTSTDANRFVSQPPVQWGPATSQADVVVDPLAGLQTISGWGGCFNELGYQALLTLDEQPRQEVLKALFDPKDGLRLSICRTPIGASDFALDGYSLDDQPDDYDLAHFSIDRDRKLLIPFIKAAIKYRADLKVWASPWSPPGWMKDNGVYHGGHLRNDPKVLDAYARYLAKYVQSYRAEGINLYAVHVQNEPVSDTIYPSCPWPDPLPLRDLIRDHLGPTFKAQHVQAEIWLGTMSESRLAWFTAILDDATTYSYLGGIGLQYEGRKVAGQLHSRYPKLPLMQTETRCHAGKNSWSDAQDTFRLIQQFLDGGCTSYMLWNMVLDERCVSTWGWHQNATIVIDTHKHAILYTPEFVLMKHFSGTVEPGSVYLRASGPYHDALAFRRPDGAVVVIVSNDGDKEQSIRVQIGAEVSSLLLPAKSFGTLIKAAG